MVGSPPAGGTGADDSAGSSSGRCSPDGVQRLLTRVSWQENRTRPARTTEEIHREVGSTLGSPPGHQHHATLRGRRVRMLYDRSCTGCTGGWGGRLMADMPVSAIVASGSRFLPREEVPR